MGLQTAIFSMYTDKAGKVDARGAIFATNSYQIVRKAPFGMNIDTRGVII